MPGVTTAYQTGIHADRPAANAGCILYSCTTHSLVYRSDGTTWTTFLTLSGFSGAADDVTYDNTTSGLTATDVQAAIDELETLVGGGGSAGWTTDVNETGSTFTNFTGLSGTWASNGTIIQQTATGASAKRARFNNPLKFGITVVEMDIRIPAAADGYAGFLLGFPGTDTGTFPLVTLTVDGTDRLFIGRDAAAEDASFNTTVTLNTWYTIKARIVGSSRIEVFKDGTFLGTGTVAYLNGLTSFLGLRAFNGAADYRNITVKTLDLP